MSGTSLDTVFQVSKWIGNTIFHQCIAVVAIYAIWVAIENYSNPFSWHVILSTLGVVPLMAESMILFSKDNVWSQEISRKQKYWIHGILVFIASFLVITGIALEIDRKAQYSGVKHFVSGHAITGLISMIFIIFGLICGPLAFTSSALTNYARPVWFKLVHNILGQIGYIMAIVCLCLGYYTSWFSYYTSESSRTVATIATVLAAVWSLICAWQSIYNQVKSVTRMN